MHINNINIKNSIEKQFFTLEKRAVAAETALREKTQLLRTTEESFRLDGTVFYCNTMPPFNILQ